jgi:stress-induced morphogen
MGTEEYVAMATITRNPGQADQLLLDIKTALDAYERDHPGSVASLYRQNSGSVRIRVIDDRFAGMSKPDRDDDVWNYLSRLLPEDTLQEISILVVLPKAELVSSFMNLEFNDPTPSRL